VRSRVGAHESPIARLARGGVTAGLAALLIFALSAAMAAAKPAKQAPRYSPGDLDRSFGDRGRAIFALPPQEVIPGYLATPYPQATAIAGSPSGKLVAATRTQILQLGPGGKLDRRFGGGGRVKIEAPAGWMFLLADVAADSRGRILVVGSVVSLSEETTPGPVEYPRVSGPPRRLAAVYRYLPSGSLDRGFGQNGVLTSDFAQLPATGPGPFDYRFGVASVGATDVAVAPDDGFVLSGYSVKHVSTCGIPATPTYEVRAYVARLAADGSLVPSFGTNGVVTDEGVERLGAATLDPAGRIALPAASGGYCGVRGPELQERLLSLGPSGQPDASFGTAGSLLRSGLNVADIAFDRRGRLLVLGRPAVTDSNLRPQVRRLLSNGSPDPAFGRQGSTSPRLPAGAHLTDLTVDGRGRVLLAGSAPAVFGLGSDFLLARLSSGGRADRRFGNRGWVRTGFIPGVKAQASAISLDARGRIVLGGTLTGPELRSGHAFAFARYLPRAN